MGAFIHAVDKELKTPLMYAAENDHIAIVKYLLKCKANIKQKVRQRPGKSLYYFASSI
jgi:ankyrin repeat protein